MKGYLIKIIPPKGYRVHRLELARWHVVAIATALAAFVGILLGSCVLAVYRAEARVHELGRVTDDQQQRLTRIGQQARALGEELQQVQRQNRQIGRLMGVDRGADSPSARPNAGKRAPARGDRFQQVSDRIEALEAESERARVEANRVRRIAFRVLNIRRFDELVRARVVAAIPSIDPVDGAAIASAFGWRMDPWPSFHAGVDLDADYGETVRAAAAGTVAFVGWDGGYGLKVDVDHGNGYHTWYAHLSRADVQAGQYVRKAQPIALVGESGDATGPHLHYQVMFGGHAVDPAPFLTGVPPKVLAALK